MERLSTPRVQEIVFTLLILSTLTLSILVVPAFAGSSNNVGKHAYKINIIGRPNTWQGVSDSGSNSKTIFISLFVEEGLVTCEATSGSYTTGYETTNPEPGQRIYFYTNTANTFSVEDRDATDGKAVVSIPQTPNGYNVYVRVLGGSNKNFPGCLDADAYQYLSTVEGVDYYYYIGHLDANRKLGTPEKVNVRELFYNNGVSYFDNVWSDYFWVLQNNGLRNMQLIFYEV